MPGNAGFSNDVLWPLFHYMPLPIYQSEPTDRVSSSRSTRQLARIHHTVQIGRATSELQSQR